MPDTIRGNLSQEQCSDCGEIGSMFQHWGPLVPKGKVGTFCGYCWNERQERHARGEPPLPLGVKPPGVPRGFKTKACKVTTQNGSVYSFSEPNRLLERTVHCVRQDKKENPDFTRCKIICLVKGKPLYLKPLNSPESNLNGWRTSPVASIESLPSKG